MEVPYHRNKSNHGKNKWKKLARLYKQILDCTNEGLHATNEMVRYLKDNVDTKSGLGHTVHSINELVFEEGITVKEHSEKYIKGVGKLNIAASWVCSFKYLCNHVF